MQTNIIVAMDQNSGIGKDNKIPWRLNEDMKTFKSLTKGNCIVMGRKTFESIGRPLKNRINIVLTEKKDYKQKGVLVANDVSDVLNIMKEYGDKDLFVCGGSRVYRSFMPLADNIYITLVSIKCDCDTHFVYEQSYLWNEAKWKYDKTIFLQRKNEKNEYNSRMLLFKRAN